MMTTIPVTVLLGLALLAVLSPTVMGGCQRYWSGTAPICGHAQCNGCTEIRRDDYGNGGKCVTGTAHGFYVLMKLNYACRAS